MLMASETLALQSEHSGSQTSPGAGALTAAAQLGMIKPFLGSCV
jgi:hypothetical protein